MTQSDPQMQWPDCEMNRGSKPRSQLRPGTPSRFVAELKQFLRFPSVSSEPAHSKDIRSCAVWLARHLQNIGLDRVRIIPTRGNPIVYASWLRAAGCPTLIIYGHYDVVSAGPLRAWRTPPFTPTLQNSNLHAR